MSLKTRMNATYRLQLSKDFTLHDLLPFVDYLHDLGISHLYLSPLLTSSSGSNHGYDGTDMETVSEERGGEEALKALDRYICTLDPPMHLLLDIVPNHMAACVENKYWLDVLSKGRQSEFWRFFDMRLDEEAKISLPVLDASARELVDQKKLSIGFHDDKPALLYGDSFFPLKPESVEHVQKNYFEQGIPENQIPANDILAILDEQHYALDNWREATSFSYRRFFDVCGLIGLKVEDRNVYDLTHKKLFELLNELPSIDGVRVDHIDGLLDPKTYLERLSKTVDHIWIEKILVGNEKIVEDWPVEGTSGYEFINHLNRFLIKPSGYAAIKDYWVKQVQPQWHNFDQCVTEAKEFILQKLFDCELERLVTLFTTDQSEHDEAKKFWAALTVALPVYRTYYQDGAMTAQDSQWLQQACKKARQHSADFTALETKFLPTLLQPKTPQQKQALREWQQLSGPVMAKGLEDTAHYRYTPLTACNEVGCEPDSEAETKDSFIGFLNDRNEKYPVSLNATSTHDTKRSEDARHRLYALADMPGQWLAYYRTVLDLPLAGAEKVAADTVYFLCEAVICAWPLNHVIDEAFKLRLWHYMEKAMFEAKVKTSHNKPDPAYEAKIKAYTEAVLNDPVFVDLTKKFVEPVMLSGAVNSLTAITLKILAPGVPDIYQANESWDFSLVDPDNRRPVDFAGHRQTLKNITAAAQQGQTALLPDLLSQWRDGGVKLWLTQRLLEIRRAHLLPCDNLVLTAVKVSGELADHLIAFTIDGAALSVVVPRYPYELLRETATPDLSNVAWGDTKIHWPSQPNRSYINLIDGQHFSAIDIIDPAKLFRHFPIAIILAS